MAVPYTKQMLIERVKKHLANGFPNVDFSLTNNEILLYIDAAIPFVLRGQAFENSKVTGFFEVPDAYQVSYSFTLTTKSDITGEWSLTLPQPPLALPTGYDIARVYIGSVANGQGDDAYPLKAKRAAYRKLLPSPLGYHYRVEGQTMYLKATNGASLYNESVTVTLPISRTASVSDPLYLLDDALDTLFTKVITQIKDRFGIPQDVVQDGLPAGNKTS